jgi:hypothetical protein
MEGELVRIVFAKTRPTSTPKNAKKGVVRLYFHEPKQRCLLIDDRGRHTVNEVTCRKKGLIPKTQG